ncbi:SUMF1/EgtB/PvdO family nonheme iron enzyme [Opitutales bacterium]|nr:SUMF1/EgtB/PvdO family nonheme iron enzyme [Opitutales bacterium]
MSIFAMQLANAFSARELSGRQNSLKSSIHKLSSGTKLVKAQDDSGMLSVKMKMDAAKYRNASSTNKLASAVSYTDMQDGIMNNTQSILTRMAELKGLSINDPLKSEQDIDAYNNEFRDLQRQLFQLSKTIFNGTSLFATTTEMYGGNAVKFRGNESEENTFNISTLNSVAVISIAKLSFLDALNIEGCRSSSIDSYNVQLDGSTEIEMLSMKPNTSTIPNEFYIGRYEVTEKQWETVMTGNTNGIPTVPSWQGGVDPNRPVQSVSWNDVQVFLDRLNTQQKDILPEGWEYDLPTHDEWVYAYRADSTTDYYWGNTLTPANANYNWDGNGITGIDHNRPLKVCSYAPNDWGLYDMAGNVAEYTKDDHPSALGAKIQAGGGFRHGVESLTYYKTGKLNTNSKFLDFGFRLALKKSDSNVSDLNELLKITAANEDNKSTLNLSDFNTSYFERAIENISYLRAQTSATKSRLKFTSDLEYKNKSLTIKAYGRIADVDYALERSYLTKQKKYDFCICCYDRSGKYNGGCCASYVK